MTAIGFTFSVWAAALVLMVVLSPVMLALGVLWVEHLKRRAARRRLAADADYQHGALMRGNLVGGTFGRYPPVLYSPTRREQLR
jgi:CHASE1-domain containing sensor protein